MVTPLHGGSGGGIERLRFPDQPDRLPPHKMTLRQESDQVRNAIIDATMPRHGCSRPGQHRGVISMPVQCTCPTCGAAFFRAPTKRKRYCSEACRPVVTDADRFWMRVNKNGPIQAHRPDLGPCWLWDRPSNDGYGQMWLDGRLQQAHVISYEMQVGSVPDGLTLDHLCHNGDPECPSGPACQHRRCVNPGHLEPVTRGQNVLRGESPLARNARKTVCPKGHPYDEANTLLEDRGVYRPSRRCRECRRASDLRRNERRRAS